MATRALQQVVNYVAWDTSANAMKTGDSANHSTSWEKDGTRSATTNATAEVDATNLPGLYKVTMTSTETDCIQGVLGGKSTTSGIVLIPTMVSFDYLNTSAPAAAGVPDVNVKNMNNVSGSAITTIKAVQGLTTADTVVNLTNAPTAGDLTSTMKSSVLTQVESALATDTYAEPGAGTPGSTISLAAKIGYLFKAWRNLTTQTATVYALTSASDNATVDQKATVSDDGTTFTRTNVVTGP